jgi:hypothetical protein
MKQKPPRKLKCYGCRNGIEDVEKGRSILSERKWRFLCGECHEMWATFPADRKDNFLAKPKLPILKRRLARKKEVLLEGKRIPAEQNIYLSSPFCYPEIIALLWRQRVSP